MQTLILKFVGIALLVGAAGFFIWDYINTKEELAVKDATLESTVNAFSEYATRTENEVEAYRQSTEILSGKYQAARDERDEEFKAIANRDLDKMAKRHPDLLKPILNDRLSRLLGNLKAASEATRNSEAASAISP